MVGKDNSVQLTDSKTTASNFQIEIDENEEEKYFSIQAVVSSPGPEREQQGLKIYFNKPKFFGRKEPVLTAKFFSKSTENSHFEIRSRMSYKKEISAQHAAAQWEKRSGSGGDVYFIKPASTKKALAFFKDGSGYTLCVQDVSKLEKKSESYHMLFKLVSNKQL